MTPSPTKKKKKILNIHKELKRNMQQRGWGAISAPEKRGDTRS
jgi:hypothetical protein